MNMRRQIVKGGVVQEIFVKFESVCYNLSN